MGRRPMPARNRRRSAGSTDISSLSAPRQRRNASLSTSARAAAADASTGPVDSHRNRETRGHHVIGHEPQPRQCGQRVRDPEPISRAAATPRSMNARYRPATG